MSKHPASATSWETAAASAPMARQFLQIKRQFPDAIIFFRLGDFYETFNEDAEIASRVLNITFTSRKMQGDDRWSMAGVPHHSVNSYLTRMVRQGYKCAIVDQMEEPTGKLVERAVTRVLTPGTIVEPNMLDARKNNYLAALALEGDRVGLAYCDVTTGEFCATQLHGSDVMTQLRYELERLQPAEILVADRAAGRKPTRVQKGASETQDPALSSLAFPLSPYPGWRFDFDTARQTLFDHFKVGSLDGFGLASLPLAVRAAGAIIAYVRDNQLGAADQLVNLNTYSTAHYMALDAPTRRNLELVQGTRSGGVAGSLLGVLDQTVTSMGGRLLRAWLAQPLLNVDEIQTRLDAVTAFFDDHLTRAGVTERLKGMNDLERLTNRVVQRIATPRDLLAIKKTLEALPALIGLIGGQPAPDPDTAPRLDQTFVQTPQEELESEIDEAEPTETPEAIWESLGQRGPAVSQASTPVKREKKPTPRRTASTRYQGLARISEDGPRPLTASPSYVVNGSGQNLLGLLPAPIDHCPDILDLISRAIAPEPPATLGAPGVIAPGYSAELDGIQSAVSHAKEWVASLETRERDRTGIKSLKVGFNKVFGYYLEITNANTNAAPPDYIRKQTLVNAERYITPDLKEYESLILNAEERTVELEKRLFRGVGEEIAASASRLLDAARAIAYLDVVTSLAEVARRYNYVRPQVASGELVIRGGRHPVVERTLEDTAFVANDTHLAEGDIIILTGPNMSGKSVYLKQTALICLLAQIGSYVPADEASLPLVDRIFTRIGAHDEIAQHQSTFMVEMVETANILRHATPRSLIILDEVGRGTSTYDGLSIAWAVVEYLHNNPDLRAKTLFATHYHELTELADRLPRVRNYNVAVAEEGDGVVFLHKIVPGGADRSYGIHVAQLAGLPRAVIHRASEILADLEQEARAPGAPRPGDHRPLQLSMFTTQDPLIQELRELNVNQMTPLDAINTLYQLQKKAQASTP